MVSNNKFLIDTNEHENMGDPPEVFPSKVIVWNVTFDEENDELRLFYRRSATHDLGNDDFDTFRDYLNDIVGSHEPSHWNDNPAEPIEGKSPLSINYTEYAYMVFVLRGKKWQFAINHVPFKVRVGGRRFYRMARCAWWDPGEAETVIREEPESAINCTTAFFIADAAADQSENGDANGRFRTPFNIYLNLILRRRDDRLRLLPIVIDPDVGHPEGTQP